MSEWTYCGLPFTDPGDSLGFIYLIVCQENAKQYIGRKMFTAAAHRQIKGKKKKYRKDSGWKDYWSSSDELKADLTLYGKSKFTRVILHLCESKSVMTYLENYEIFTRHALIRTDFYNQWLTARVRKANLMSTTLPERFT